MGQFVFETQINAPVEKVFALISDIRSAPQRVTAIKKVEVLTDGPIGVGTRFKETRVMFGKEATETMEFTAFDPPRSYTVTAYSCGNHYESTFRCAPEGQGTKVTMTFVCTPKTFFAKLFSPLGKLMSGMIRKCVMKDLEDLAKAAEGTAMAGV